MSDLRKNSSDMLSTDLNVRSIQTVVADISGHAIGHKAAYGAAFGKELPYLRAADVYQAGVNKAHSFGQRRGVDGRTATGIYHYAIMAEYVAPGIPLAEALPVVSTYEQYEPAVGIVTAHRLKGVPHIRRTGHAKLIVGGMHALLAFERKLYHL